MTIKHLLTAVLSICWIHFSGLAFAAPQGSASVPRFDMVPGTRTAFLARAVKDSIDRGQVVEATVVIRSNAITNQSIVEYEDQGRGPKGERLGSSRVNTQKYHARRNEIARLKGTVIQAVGANEMEVLQDYSELHVLHVRIKSKMALERLRLSEDVEGVYEIQVGSPVLASSLPSIGQVNVPVEWRGSATTVGVVDTGIDVLNPAFGTCTPTTLGSQGCKIYYQDTEPGVTGPYNHGTHVAATVLGVAPDSRIISYGIGLNGTSVQAINGFNRILLLRNTYYIVAINMSYEFGLPADQPCNNSVFSSVLNDVRNYGIVPVIAAGNNSSDQYLTDPACTSQAFSVTATDDAGYLAWFSNFNNLVDLSAPGVDITAAGETMSGTSMAAPHVAGAIASIRWRYPGYTVQQLTDVLVLSGTMPNTNDARLPYRNSATRRLNLGNVRLNYDITPNPFSFVPATAWPNSYAVSNVVTITGINAPVWAYITGGEVSIAGGPFQTQGGYINNGQTIRLRLISNRQVGQVQSATATIGGFSASFAVTTAPPNYAILPVLELLLSD